MKPFLAAHWKNLLMFNYEIEPHILYPYLPKGTELDLWNNTCYVSLVGFMFLNTKISGISIPYFKSFEEFNLRFYVRFKDDRQWKRGVIFIRELVPKRMISLVANAFYGERYLYVPMKNSFKENTDSYEIKYEWLFKKEWNFIKAVTCKMATPAMENSEEEFITEHYWGYTKLTDTSTSEYEVKHPKWNTHKVSSFELHCNVAEMYGDKFKDCFGKPTSVFMADGSEVAVMARRIIKFPL